MEAPVAADELEAIGALGALAFAANTARQTSARVPALPPAHRSKQSPQQKWVQCCKCDKWRQVPFTLTDEQLTDDWECRHNVWDPPHSTCDAPQVMTDEQIDQLLAGQTLDAQQEVIAHEEMDVEYDYEEGEEGYDDRGYEGADEEGDNAADVGEEVRRIMRAGKARRTAQTLPRRYEDAVDLPGFVGRGQRAGAAGGVSNGTGPARKAGAAPAARTAVRSRQGPPAKSMVLPPLAESALAHQPQLLQQQQQIPYQEPQAHEPDATQGSLHEPHEQSRRSAAKSGRGNRSRNAKGSGGGSKAGTPFGGVDEAAAEALMGLTGGVGGPEAPEQTVGEYMQPPSATAQQVDVPAAMMLTPPVVMRRPEYPHPKATLAPGRVVWARVEGHEWWPAKIVRRRAVPREVGPPPGGPELALYYIPVVFFTANGIPREVDERSDTIEGIVSSSLRALTGGPTRERASSSGVASVTGDSEEAEYAWLSLDCLKPFKLGDVSGTEGAAPSGDPLLKASVAAAEASVRAAAQRADALHIDSDSDGGWGVPSARSPPQYTLQRLQQRGKARGKTARRGSRNRSGRKGRGRGRGQSEDELSEAEAGDAGSGGMEPSQPSTSNAPVIEAILGWRHPLTEQQRQAERDKQTAANALQARLLDTWLKQTRGVQEPARAVQPAAPSAAAAQAAQAAASAAQPSSDAQQAAETQAPQPATAAGAAAEAVKAEEGVQEGTQAVAPAPATAATEPAAQPSGQEAAPMAVDEPAVAAAAEPSATTAAGTAAPAAAEPAAAAEGQAAPMDTEAQAAAPQAEAAPAAATQPQPEAPPQPAAPAQEAAAQPAEDPSAPEYLVKYSHKSHFHNAWLKESEVMALAKRKLLNFKKKHGDAPCNLQQPEWTVPERFIARRPHPTEPGWEVLVKWCELGYEHATWEAEGSGVLIQPQYFPLHQQMWARQTHALSRASPVKQQQAASIRAAAHAGVGDIAQRAAAAPAESATLYTHQLQALNALRRMWAAGKHTIFADEPGLGKTATAVAYLQSLQFEFHAAAPLLIVAPAAQLAQWEAEWKFWAGGRSEGGAEASSSSPCNVVVYSGCTAARTIIHDNELWLSPSSLDNKHKTVHQKGSHGGAGMQPLPKPDVVFASYEAVIADQGALSAMSWETVLLDLRHKSRSVQMPRAHLALQDVYARHRVVLLDGQISSLHATDDLLALLGFLHSPADGSAHHGPQPVYDLAGVLGEAALSLPQEEAAAKLHALLQPHATPSFGFSLYAAPPLCHEVMVPVHMTPQQVDAYQTVLARHYEVLTDPKPPRHLGHRAAQLKFICNELRQVTTHLGLVPELDSHAQHTQPPTIEPAKQQSDAGAASTAADAAQGAPAAAAGADAPAADKRQGTPPTHHTPTTSPQTTQSGKLQTLAALLDVIGATGKPVLVVTQLRKSMELLTTWAASTLGKGACLCLDSQVPTPAQYLQARRLATGASDKPVRLVVTMADACGLGTDLPTVGTVVLFDSEWQPVLDILALRRARCLGEAGSRVPVLRFVTGPTVEEKLLALADTPGAAHALASVFHFAPHARLSAVGPRLLEAVLRHGAEPLFGAAAGAGAAAVSAATGAAVVTAQEAKAAPAAAAGDTPAAAADGTEAAKDTPMTDATEPQLQPQPDAADAQPKQPAVASAPTPSAVQPTQQVPLTAAQLQWLLTQAQQAAPPSVPQDQAKPDLQAVGCTTGTLGAGDESAPAPPPGRTYQARVWCESVLSVVAQLSPDADAGDEAALAALAADTAAPGTMDVDQPQHAAADKQGHADAADAGKKTADAAASAAHAKHWQALLADRWAALVKVDEAHAASGGKSLYSQRMYDPEHGYIDKDGLGHHDDDQHSGDGMGHEEDGSDDGVGDHGAGGHGHRQGGVGPGGPQGVPGGITVPPVVAPLQPRLLTSGQAQQHHQHHHHHHGHHQQPQQPMDADTGRAGGKGARAGGRAGSAPLAGPTAVAKQPASRSSRGNRNRRRGDDEEPAPQPLPPHAGPQGPGTYTYGYTGHIQGLPGQLNAPHANGNAPHERGGGKRRRRGEEELAPAPPPMQQGGPVPAGGIVAVQSVRDVLTREVQRMDAIKALIAEPSTLEHAVAQRAYVRLKTVANDLELPAEALPGILDMARQVADILLTMRQDDEPASDFQDHTLVAVVAVAAHLMKATLGDSYGLPWLAERYHHDPQALDQVFWHILTRLSYYRELHVKLQQLADEMGGAALQSPMAGVAGADKRDALGPMSPAHQQQQPQQQVVVSEVDSFSVRLESILSTDMSQVVLQAVSQENIPLGPLATLMPLLQMAGVLNEGSIKNALKSVRECQEQLVVLDRSQQLKVQHIQKEYQDFMERVRAKAQSAIDTANRDFTQAKTALTSKMNLMVDYLQNQIPLQQLQHAAQQIHRAAQVASQQQQQQGGGAPGQGEAPADGSARAAAAENAQPLAAANSGDQSKAASGAAGPTASQENAPGQVTAQSQPTQQQQQQPQPQQQAAQVQVHPQPTATVVAVPVSAALAVAGAAGGAPLPPGATLVAAGPAAATLQELFRAVLYGQLPIEAIPEPLRSQIANMIQSERMRPLGMTAAEQIIAMMSAQQQQHQLGLAAAAAAAQGQGGPPPRLAPHHGAAMTAGGIVVPPAVQLAGRAVEGQPGHGAGRVASPTAAMAGVKRGAAAAPPGQPVAKAVVPPGISAAAVAASQGLQHIPISAYQALIAQQQQQRPPIVQSQGPAAAMSRGVITKTGPDPVPPPAEPLAAPAAQQVVTPKLSAGAAQPAAAQPTAVPPAIRPTGGTLNSVSSGTVVWGPPPSVTTPPRPAGAQTVTTGPGPSGSIVTTSQLPPLPIPQAAADAAAGPAVEVAVPVPEPEPASGAEGSSSQHASPPLPPVSVPPPAPSFGLVPPSTKVTSSVPASFAVPLPVPVPVRIVESSTPSPTPTPQIAVPPPSDTQPADETLTQAVTVPPPAPPQPAAAPQPAAEPEARAQVADRAATPPQAPEAAAAPPAMAVPPSEAPPQPPAAPAGGLPTQAPEAQGPAPMEVTVPPAEPPAAASAGVQGGGSAAGAIEASGVGLGAMEGVEEEDDEAKAFHAHLSQALC